MEGLTRVIFYFKQVKDNKKKQQKGLLKIKDTKLFFFKKGLFFLGIFYFKKKDKKKR